MSIDDDTQDLEHIPQHVVDKIKDQIVGDGKSMSNLLGDAKQVPEVGLDLLKTFGGTAYEAVQDGRNQSCAMFRVMNNDFGGRIYEHGASDPYSAAKRTRI